MPITKKYPLEEVLAACDIYAKTTGRRVTYEYGLIKGVNDSEEDANELIDLLKNRNSHVNLIPINPIKESEFTGSSRKITLNFKNKLEKSQINVTIRREMGTDIDGACGQLRGRNSKI
jgi:23S rRNA (adenine2503-C2)-methyltransferase